MTRGLAAACAVLVALGAGVARAGDFTDAELAGHAQRGYLEGAWAKAGSLDDADYRELLRVDDDASGVQAVALERRRDHAVVVVYAGTSVKEPADLLADLGIVAAELRYLVADAAAGVVELAQAKRWLPPARAASSRAALAGPGRGIERRDRAWRDHAAELRAAGPEVTPALEAQLVVARRFLEQVLALRDLDGRPITVGGLIVTGHSLGGYLVQIVAAERGARGVTFNAPGAQHHAPALHSAIVRNLTRRHDLVGTFGVHLGTTEAWDDVPFKAKKGESKLYFARNHSIEQFRLTLERAGV